MREKLRRADKMQVKETRRHFRMVRSSRYTECPHDYRKNDVFVRYQQINDDEVKVFFAVCAAI